MVFNGFDFEGGICRYPVRDDGGNAGGFSRSESGVAGYYNSRFDKKYISKGKFWTTIITAVGLLGLAGVIGGNYLSSRQDKKIQPLVEEDRRDQIRDSVINDGQVKLSGNFDSFKFYSDSVNEAQTNALAKLYSELSSEISRRSALEDSLTANRERDSLGREEYIALHETDSTSIAKDSGRIDAAESKLVDLSKEVKYIGDVVSGDFNSIKDSLYDGIGFFRDTYAGALNSRLGSERNKNPSGTSGGKVDYVTKNGKLTKKGRKEIMKLANMTGVDKEVEDFAVKRSKGDASNEEREKFTRREALTLFRKDLETSNYRYLDYQYLGDPSSQKYIETNAAKAVLDSAEASF